jgi:tetratricopeptide (TPR) repeat protein
VGEERPELEARLARLGAERLAAELIDLAGQDRDIERRVKLLVREVDPDALGLELKRRIAGLRRSSRFASYQESFRLARQFDDLVMAIEDKVLPLDPAKAFELADAFLSTDRKTFERVDDSSGVVSDAYREACGTWLRAAALVKGKKDWVERIYRVTAEDDYGVRETLLQQASILLSEDELRRLARRYEKDAQEAKTDADKRDRGGFSATVRLGLVAEALRDPALFERSLTLRGGGLNDLQRISVARRYLECGQPEPAIERLEAIRDRDPWDRWILLAEAYRQKGQRNEQVRCLWRLFEGTAHFGTYEELLKLLPAGKRAEAKERAKGMALALGDALSAASFLLRVGASDDAERLVVDRIAELEGTYYEHLKSLAMLAAQHGRPRIEMLCYRELLSGILKAARSKAYGHAARYYRRLKELDQVIDDYGAVGDHQAFLEALREQHGRKYSFWRRVEG